MYKILLSPLIEIANLKKTRTLGQAFIAAIVSALVFGIISLVYTRAQAVIFSLVMVVIVFVLTLFMALMLTVYMHFFSTGKVYADSLTTLAYGSVFLSVGLLVAVIVSFVPYIGIPLGFVLAAASSVVSNAVTLKIGAELFETDMLTILIGFVLIWLGIMLATYLSASLTIGGVLATLPLPSLPIA